MTTETTVGRFGRYGGRYVPETLVPALLELEEAYAKASAEKERAAKFFSKKRRLNGEFPVTSVEIRKLEQRRAAEQLAAIKQLQEAW